jgi:hypothetical protein
VEGLNWWLSDDGGYPLFIRTAWAVVRSIGFLVLIWQVHRGRATAAPFAVVLSVTTIFSVARLIVPRQGLPSLVGIAGFVLVTTLSAVVLLLFYRSPTVKEYLKQHANRIVVTRNGIDWKPVPPKRPPVPAWLLTARVAAFSYAPLMAVGAAVAIGQIFKGRLGVLPAVVLWFGASITVSYAVLIVTLFLIKGKRWAPAGLTVLTALVLAIHLPLCWFLLGQDGLIRDGAPLFVCAMLALLALSRYRANNPANAT